MRKWHKGFIFCLCFFLLMAVGTAWSDSCPYCNLDYGDPMPGDESRVYALRSEHEASCSYRPAAGGSSGGEDYQTTPAWTAEDQRLYEQQLLAEQEKRRQEEDKKRKENIKREAEKRAENAARKLEWEQKKSELVAQMKGSSPLETQGSLKTAQSYPVVLTPRGIKSENELIGDEKKEAVRTSVLNPNISFSASPSQMENMRRAFWLYQKAAQATSPHEAAFLNQQADEAAQGHPLKVQVPPAPETASQINKEQLQEFQSLTTEVEKQKIEIEMIGRNRRAIEDKNYSFKNRAQELENQLKAVREKKEAAAAEKPAEAPPFEKTAESTEIKEREKAQEQPSEEKPDEKKQEEDLLAQLLAVQKEMEDADKELGQLTKDEENAKSQIATHEKKINSLLGKKN